MRGAEWEFGALSKQAWKDTRKLTRRWRRIGVPFLAPVQLVLLTKMIFTGRKPQKRRLLLVIPWNESISPKHGLKGNIVNTLFSSLTLLEIHPKTTPRREGFANWRATRSRSFWNHFGCNSLQDNFFAMVARQIKLRPLKKKTKTIETLIYGSNIEVSLNQYSLTGKVANGLLNI